MSVCFRCGWYAAHPNAIKDDLGEVDLCSEHFETWDRCFSGKPPPSGTSKNRDKALKETIGIFKGWRDKAKNRFTQVIMFDTLVKIGRALGEDLPIPNKKNVERELPVKP